MTDAQPNILWIGADQMRADTLARTSMMTGRFAFNQQLITNADRIHALRDTLKRLCIEHGDPLSPAVCKFFGDWDTPTGQPEPSQI